MVTNIANKLASIKRKVPPAKKVAGKIEADKRRLADEAKARALEALKGPKGDKGDKGDRGPQGPKGDKGDKGDTPVLGIDYVVIHGKDGRDGSSIDVSKYIPYLGAISDVDLGAYELYSDGIHVDGATEFPPTGPGLTLAYFSDFFMLGGGSFIASMDWDTWTPLPLLIEASEIYMETIAVGIYGETVHIEGDTSVEIDGDTEINGNLVVIGTIDCGGAEDKKNRI